jgi:hypothetical protein
MSHIGALIIFRFPPAFSVAHLRVCGDGASWSNRLAPPIVRELRYGTAVSRVADSLCRLLTSGPGWLAPDNPSYHATHTVRLPRDCPAADLPTDPGPAP